jgi:hypothetical protein
VGKKAANGPFQAWTRWLSARLTIVVLVTDRVSADLTKGFGL